jgi:hypothetical protein
MADSSEQDSVHLGDGDYYISCILHLADSDVHMGYQGGKVK